MLALEDSEHLAPTPNNYRYLITMENAIIVGENWQKSVEN